MRLNSGRENRLLAVTDDAEGTGRITPLKMRYVKSPKSGMVCSRWVMRREPHSYVVEQPCVPASADSHNSTSSMQPE